jgi:hypothetical protein
VKLAVSIFCESTRDALEFYAANEGKSAWIETAKFVSVILKLWNILNVKTCTKGRNKSNESMDPIRTSWDWQLSYLRDFADFLQRWESSKKPGLTRETFLALHHTCKALADCADWLIDQRGFDVVLLGHLQSDPIESRFGWWRQMSGANYFISMKQVMDSDRKIRALSLLKYTDFNALESATDTSADNSASRADNDRTADCILNELQFSNCPSANDANVIYYVSGYLARSVVRMFTCDYCKEALVSSDDVEPIQMDETLQYASSTFFEDVNRGGLKKPTEFTFMLTVSCWKVFEEIRNSDSLLHKFLSAAHHQKLFCSIMERLSGSLCLENSDTLH